MSGPLILVSLVTAMKATVLLEDEKVGLAELNKHFYEYGIQVYISVWGNPLYIDGVTPSKWGVLARPAKLADFVSGANQMHFLVSGYLNALFEVIIFFL